jgi:DNA-binding transcriptional MerR regulator
MNYTVGQLAKRAGLTVRSLHHYEQLGLLRPSGRSEAGYRHYGEADVLRLHRLLALRDAGLSLKDIGPLLDGEAPQPLAEVLRQQIAQIEQRLIEQERLLATLKNAARRLELHGDGGDALNVLLDAIAVGRINQRHLSPEQFRQLNRHWDSVPAEQRDSFEREWPALIRRAQEAMAAGEDPASPELQQLVQRWITLQDYFKQISPELNDAIKQMVQSEPELHRQAGLTPELLAYLREAAVIYRAGLPTKDKP